MVSEPGGIRTQDPRIKSPKGAAPPYNPGELIALFLKSRRDGLSPRTLETYDGYLNRANSVIGIGVNAWDIKAFLDNLPCSQGGKHAYFRALRAFYNWLYSPKSGMGLNAQDNPMLLVEAPKVGRRILPSHTSERLDYLIGQVESMRDKAIISLKIATSLYNCE